MELINHKGMWLNPDAAASLARFEAKYGIQPITSAGRTVEQQQAMIDRYDAGGVYNRPPYLYNPRRPASEGRHVVDGGMAIDTIDPNIFHQYGAAYGFMFNYAYDVVHFEYEKNKDTHLNDKPAEQANSPIATGDDVFICSYAGHGARQGNWLGGPGKFRKFTPEEWGNGAVQKSVAGLPIITPANDREFDLLRAVWS